MRRLVTRTIASLACAVCAALVAPNSANAESDRSPTDLLPGASKVAVQLDVERLKKSKYFDRALEFLKSRMRQRDNYSKFFDSENGYHIGKDVARVAVGVPKGRINARSPELDRGVLVVDGNFSEEKTIELVEQGDVEVESRTLGDDLEIHEVEGTEFTVRSGGRLVVVTGPESYRQTAWETVRGKSASFASVSKRENLLQHVDTDRTLWVVNRAGGTTKGGKSIRSTTVGFDLDDGAELQLVSQADTKSGAKSIAEQIAALKKTGGENTMVQMFGAGPLVENLSWERRETAVVATTSMTAKELDTLVQMVKQSVQASQTSMPSGEKTGSGASEDGAGSDSDTDGKASEADDGASGESSDDEEEATSDGEGREREETEDGVDADFN